MVFITDGHEAPPIDPQSPFAMPDDVQPGQIRGWVVGAGGDTPQPIPHTDDEDHRIGYWNARDVIQIISEDGTKHPERGASVGLARAASEGARASGWASTTRV